MLKPVLCALLAAATLPAAATASPKPATCGRTDPRGDVELADQVTVDAPHIDIVAYDVQVTRTEVVALIRAAAGGDANGRWSLTFTSGKREYYFSAYRPAALVDDLDTPEDDTTYIGYFARVSDRPDLPARGSISDAGEVRIRVRLKDLGAAVPKRGTLRNLSLWAYRAIGSQARLSDDAGSPC